MPFPEYASSSNFSDLICSSDEETNSIEYFPCETLLDLSINYLLTKSYPLNANIKLKRAIRALIIEDGHIYLNSRKRRVKVIASTDKQDIKCLPLRSSLWSLRCYEYEGREYQSWYVIS